MAELVPASELAGGNKGGSPANLSIWVEDRSTAGEMSPIRWYSRRTSESPRLICAYICVSALDYCNCDFAARNIVNNHDYTYIRQPLVASLF